ncbi:MAG: DNA replication/repair protein RecF [Chthonomonadales bacterium]
MNVTELRLMGFRNYEELCFTPSNRINILVGQNAQGKSNLLEALFMLATTKSLRASKESELIYHTEFAEATNASICADIFRERDGEALLEIHLSTTEKRAIKVNGVRKPRAIDLLGNLNAVFFGSVELGIVSGEPSLRRRYLDLELSQISPKYVYNLASYKKILEQRNRLLKELRDRPFKNSGLEAWTDQLVQIGSALMEKRQFFLENIAPMADEKHRYLTGNAESLEVKYLPSIEVASGSSPEKFADAFYEAMRGVESEEIRRGTTIVGPHRDDLQFFINGKDARAFGSQGQQRTVALALKLAEYGLMESHVGEAPILLLDDVLSDLDDARRKCLLEHVESHGQTFITCTNTRAFPKSALDCASEFQVSAGRLAKVK